MRTRHTILMGAVALALPALLGATTGSVASAKKPPANPITCSNFGTNITFSVPYTLAGVATSSKTGGTTTVMSNRFNCGSGVNNASFPNLSIPAGKNVKLAKTDSRYNKATGVKYVEGTTASFVSGGSKALKKGLKYINFTVNSAATQFKMKGSPVLVLGNDPCPGEVGYHINGQVKTGTYNTKAAFINVCLSTDTGTNVSGNFLGDLLNKHFTGSVTGAVIDATHGTAQL